MPIPPATPVSNNEMNNYMKCISVSSSTGTRSQSGAQTQPKVTKHNKNITADRLRMHCTMLKQVTFNCNKMLNKIMAVFYTLALNFKHIPWVVKKKRKRIREKEVNVPDVFPELSRKSAIRQK